jgi:transketolase
MPGLVLVRPADANETAQAWRLAVEAERPVGLALTRQDVPVLEGTTELAGAGVAKGGYVLAEVAAGGAGAGAGAAGAGAGAAPQIVLIGTGSEVQLCLGAATALGEAGVAARVVSLPCWVWFEEQSEAYRAEVLPPGVPALSVEAGATFGWSRYADASIGLDHFGASAPGAVVMEKFGFTVENVVERAQALLAETSKTSKTSATSAKRARST